jgi:hypothetical protein
MQVGPWYKKIGLLFLAYEIRLHLYYKVRCVSVCGHSNVRLTSPPVLKLWGTKGYLWLPYDLTEVINLIGERFKPKNIFFQKKYPMSFLPHYCHSFRITVILSGLLSFLPYYCHSFSISVIPSKYCHSFQIIQRITNSNYFQKLPIPEGREKWPPEVAINASIFKLCAAIWQDFGHFRNRPPI